jgi:proteasome lid subunit RPN8/RPN11
MAEQNTLILPARLATAIIKHARSGYPDEVCGLVAGRGDKATAVYPGRNISPTPAVTYELDHETLARMIDFEDAGLELAAIYHSHPRGPETPSPTDIAHAYYSASVYLIVSLATPEFPVIRGFRIKDEGVREIAFESEVQGYDWPRCPECV